MRRRPFSGRYPSFRADDASVPHLDHAVAEQLVHLADLGRLGCDDRVGHLLSRLVGTVGLLGLGHRHGTFVVLIIFSMKAVSNALPEESLSLSISLAVIMPLMPCSE